MIFQTKLTNGNIRDALNDDWPKIEALLIAAKIPRNICKKIKTLTEQILSRSRATKKESPLVKELIVSKLLKAFSLVCFEKGLVISPNEKKSLFADIRSTVRPQPIPQSKK